MRHGGIEWTRTPDHECKIWKHYEDPAYLGLIVKCECGNVGKISRASMRFGIPKIEWKSDAR